MEEHSIPLDSKDLSLLKRLGVPVSQINKKRGERYELANIAVKPSSSSLGWEMHLEYHLAWSNSLIVRAVDEFARSVTHAGAIVEDRLSAYYDKWEQRTSPLFVKNLHALMEGMYQTTNRARSSSK